LHEHEVGLLAALRHEGVEPLGMLHVLAGIVLGEGRVGDDPIKAVQFAILVEMARLLYGVALLDFEGLDAVQEHIHLADGPGAAVVLLPGQIQVVRVAAGLLHVLPGLDEHAAGTGCGIIDGHGFPGLDELHQKPHHLGRGVEFAALFPGAVREILDQVFVGRAEQVRELEILVAQRDFVEVLDEGDEGLVVHGPLPDLAVEIDALEHVLELVGIGVFDGRKGLVEFGAHAGLQVAQGLPAGLFGDVEIVFVGILKLLGDEVRSHAVGDVSGLVPGPVRLELVA